MNDKSKLLGGDLESGNQSFSSESQKIFNNEISEMQPSTHESKKSCFETLCKCCVNNYDLTKAEYKKFNQFRAECIILYDEKNLKHESILNELMECLKDLEVDNRSRSENISWKQLGFQVKSIKYFRGKIPELIFEQEGCIP
jgi:hypothetical protein